MTAVQVLKEEADLAYSQLTDALEGVSEPLAWAQIQLVDGEYLHTNNCIVGVVQHVAVCKLMYASHAFRETEIRWRDCFDRLEAIGTNWEATLAYLTEAHAYWKSAWDGLSDDDLDKGYSNFRGDLRPGWKLIAIVIQHDAYHAGQIEIFSSALEPSATPPDLRFEEERKHVKDLPGW